MVTVWCDGERASEEVVEHGGLVPIVRVKTTTTPQRRVFPTSSA